MASEPDPDNFFSRWSRRKLGGSEAVAPAAPSTVPAPRAAVPVAVPVSAEVPISTGAVSSDAEDSSPTAAPAPTLEEVAELGPDASYARFVTREVTPEVRHAALKKLFTDPHFNVMDGLDIYIDDYGIPDPLPEGMLRQMAQSQLLGLFAAEDAKDAADAKRLLASGPAPTDTADDAPAAATPEPPADARPPDSPTEPARAAAHEDPDLQLQPVDGPGQPGAATGPGQDARRQH